ncbi:hypothetical protein WA1_01960 [Scytonema hofmannii PCC 7110]|uniref:DUF4384 domain-containing protein n=1 Tax=Scytonema hofmannii PCC 7110 TaxID=128403 RepID=A0A139XGW9_9CYAN|nr:DUF4384 domain-containing protein [Scytonema hofmannii]KYC43937.1 hypothetical protein WA1_01960 [Scytonema hofmannii PCC 7110]
MNQRSIIASPEGISRAKAALARQNFNQKIFAEKIGFAYSTVNNFFTGKPIYRTKFEEICKFLDLDWQDIVAQSVEEETENLTPLDKLWQQLQTLGSPTEKMGVVLVKEKTLGWNWQTPNPYEKSVRVGNCIQFEVNFDNPGYLLLLQKDTSGEVWCFCPSCFASQPYLNAGKTILPQEGSSMRAFPIEGTPGQEEILAVVTKTMPGLDWLPQESDNPLQLEASHLSRLLEYINQTGEYQVLYTQYMITE